MRFKTYFQGFMYFYLELILGLNEFIALPAKKTVFHHKNGQKVTQNDHITTFIKAKLEYDPCLV